MPSVNPWLKRLQQVKRNETSLGAMRVPSPPPADLIAGDPCPACGSLERWLTPAGACGESAVRRAGGSKGSHSTARGAGKGTPAMKREHAQASGPTSAGKGVNDHPLPHPGRQSLYLLVFPVVG